MSIESMILRLANRGLLPSEHNLTIWQHADNSGWSACVETFRFSDQVVGSGDTLHAALESLMRKTNRGADL